MLFKGFTSRVGTLTLPQKLHRVVFSAPPPHNVSTRNARKEIKQEVRHVVCLRRLTLLSHRQFLSISVANGFPQSIPGIWQISQSLVLAQSSGDILATSIGPLACFELSHVVGRVAFFYLVAWQHSGGRHLSGSVGQPGQKSARGQVLEVQVSSS